MLLTPLARAYVFVLFATLPALILGIAAFGPVWMINRRKDAPWYERARYVYPFRQAVATVIAMEFFLGYSFSEILQQRLNLENDPWFMPLSLTALGLGIFYSMYLIHRRISGEYSTFRIWFVEFATMLTVRLFMFVVLIGIGYLLSPLLPLEVAWSIAWFCAYAAAMAGLGLLVLRWLGRIVTADADLKARIDAIALQMEIAPPREILVLKHQHANAFALPVLRKIIVTSRLLSELSAEEVDSIMAHEIGHLTESRGDIIKRLVVGLISVPAIIVALYHLTDPVKLIAALTVIVILRWFSSGLSQRLERRADEIAAKRQNAPGVYSEALLKLYRCNLAPAVFRRRANRTHPDLYDRMTAAGSPPPFARPLPPVRSLYFIPFSFAIVLHAIMLAGLLILIPYDLQDQRSHGYNSNERMTADDQDDGDSGYDDGFDPNDTVLTPI